jgi:hypothetical protein
MRSIMTSLAIGLTFMLAAACGGDDDDDDGGGDAPDAAVGELSCATYCANIDANCTGANKQYAMVAQCMATCAFFEDGDFDDTTGNTLGCRDYHAKAAEGDPGVHCIHAGPTGGTANQCGEICESFCTIALAACTGANEAYDDMAACMTACEDFETEDAYDTGDTTGNTIECRVYHATVASTTPDVHCPHITVASVAPHCVAAP